MKKNLTKIAAFGLIAGVAVLPATSFAADRHHWDHHRDRTNWNNIALGAGAVGLIGLLGHNDTLATIGLLGAGYSAIRASDDHRHYYDRDHIRYRPVYRHEYRRW
ncbi:MAG TPA: hypothetical protein VG944_12020 [Fimbriimonas sp.]|nr:hypothetical protein [Fimbriimonas sp.]